MRFFVAKNVLSSLWLLMFVASTAVTAGAPTQAYAQSSAVYATLCGSSSHITIARPASDSTVASSEVTVDGMVSQANQVEVYVNDEFDSTVPLTIGQSSYSTTIQVPTGTHTIRVEAINSCSGQNGDATSVVTYTPPTQASSGESAMTGVTESRGGAISVGPPSTVTQGGSATKQESAMPLGLPPLLGRPLVQALDWLNITHQDQQGGSTSLSIGRAVFVVLGMYFLVLGVGSAVVHALAGSAVFTAVTPQANAIRRRQLIRWGVRGAGLLILLLALFL